MWTEGHYEFKKGKKQKKTPLPLCDTYGADISSYLERCLVGELQSWSHSTCHTSTETHAYSERPGGIGLNPPGSAGLPIALGRISEIIQALADSHWMLIRSHRFNCTVKSQSYSQSFLLRIPVHPHLFIHYSPSYGWVYKNLAHTTWSSFYHLILTLSFLFIPDFLGSYKNSALFSPFYFLSRLSPLSPEQPSFNFQEKNPHLPLCCNYSAKQDFKKTKQQIKEKQPDCHFWKEKKTHFIFIY